jgi:hypothetical protein
MLQPVLQPVLQPWSRYCQPLLTASLTLSLLFSLTAAVSSSAIAAPAAMPIPPTQSASPSNPATQAILKKLVGTWTVERVETSPFEEFSLVFTAEGKLTILMKRLDTIEGFAINYQIDATRQPIAIDLTIEEHPKPVLTILDFVKDDRLWFQLTNTNPGEPRPTRFNQPHLFTKTSDSTTLPDNVKMIKLNDQADSEQKPQ